MSDNLSRPRNLPVSQRHKPALVPVKPAKQQQQKQS